SSWQLLRICLSALLICWLEQPRSRSQPPVASAFASRLSPAWQLSAPATQRLAQSLGAQSLGVDALGAVTPSATLCFRHDKPLVLPPVSRDAPLQRLTEEGELDVWL
ncbi:unnamed protein product, partial [Polarella glacialis]